MNIWGLSSNCIDCESFVESNSPDIPAMRGKSGWLNWFWLCLCEGLSYFNLKRFYYSYPWSHSLCKGDQCCRFLLMFWLSLLHLVPYFFFLYWSPSLSWCSVFGSISSNMCFSQSINLLMCLSLEIWMSILRTG